MEMHHWHEAERKYVNAHIKILIIHFLHGKPV